jgi:hypothetical protein
MPARLISSATRRSLTRTAVPGQFGMEPAGAVGAAAGGVDLPDEPDQPLPAYPGR